jgi:hypothetical protein
VSKFIIKKTDLLGRAIHQLYDWAETPEAMAQRADLEMLRTRFRHASMWDSTHFDFANCYRVWMLEAV